MPRLSLLTAVKRGDSVAVRGALAQNKDGIPARVEALNTAAAHNRPEVVDLLLATLPLSPMGTALTIAATNGHTGVLTRLLPRFKACRGLDEALCSAARGGHVETVDALLAAGARPSANGWRATREAWMSGHRALARRLVPESDTATVCLQALYESRWPVVAALIENLATFDWDLVETRLADADRDLDPEAQEWVRARLAVVRLAQDLDAALTPSSARHGPRL